MSRVLVLLAGTTLALTSFGMDAAQARDWRLRSIYDNYVIQSPDGYFFDDNYDTGDMSDEAIIQQRKRQTSLYQLEDDYYTPKLAPRPAKKIVAAPIIAKPVKDASIASKASVTNISQPAPAASTAVTCEKATNIVGTYGFKDVKPVGCTGKIFTFSATRGAKQYEIKISSGNGALTEVRKVQ